MRPYVYSSSAIERKGFTGWGQHLIVQGHLKWTSRDSYLVVSGSVYRGPTHCTIVLVQYRTD